MDDATTTPNAQNLGATDPSAAMSPFKVTSAELVRNFSELSDQALTEPIIITKNGRDRLVLLAIEDYQRLKKRERLARKIEDTPIEFIEALEASLKDAGLNPKYDILDEELKDWKS
jgi:prevent-host-death family protein